MATPNISVSITMDESTNTLISTPPISLAPSNVNSTTTWTNNTNIPLCVVYSWLVSTVVVQPLGTVSVYNFPGNAPLGGNPNFLLFWPYPTGSDGNLGFPVYTPLEWQKSSADGHAENVADENTGIFNRSRLHAVKPAASE